MGPLKTARRSDDPFKHDLILAKFINTNIGHEEVMLDFHAEWLVGCKVMDRK